MFVQDGALRCLRMETTAKEVKFSCRVKGTCIDQVKTQLTYLNFIGIAMLVHSWGDQTNQIGGVICKPMRGSQRNLQKISRCFIGRNTRANMSELDCLRKTGFAEGKILFSPVLGDWL
jgi:hypothetical protein